MTALLLRLSNPTQSWAGYRVSYTRTPTHPVPTRSAVAGLIGAAIGTRDLTSILTIFTLRVRVDRTNPSLTDLQTAVGPKPLEETGWVRAGRLANPTFKPPGRTDKKKYDGAYSLVGTAQVGLARRDFLPFTEFICEITSPDATDWHEAFTDPVFPLYLGRSSHPPTWPFLLGTHPNTTDPDAPDLLGVFPRVARHDDQDDNPVPVRVYRVTGDYHDHEHTYEATATPPVVRTRKEQMEWASQNLTR